MPWLRASSNSPTKSVPERHELRRNLPDAFTVKGKIRRLFVLEILSCPDWLFFPLDSIVAVNSNRIALVIDYGPEYAEYLVVALRSEDAQAPDESDESSIHDR